jgi:hypothetical protein
MYYLLGLGSISSCDSSIRLTTLSSASLTVKTFVEINTKNVNGDFLTFLVRYDNCQAVLLSVCGFGYSLHNLI